jgi:predicted nucleic acid-binding protein
MVLTDTSVWIAHFRQTEPALLGLLGNTSVLMHPVVLGELACGNLEQRDYLLKTLALIPQALTASDEEAMACIHLHKLWGRGIGWNDVHILASARLTGCRLWTLDLRLRRAAASAGVKEFFPVSVR